MKKFICFIAVMFVAAVSMNAQVATENQKFFDNVYVGVEGGVATPLDFKEVFPLNSIAGVKLGKEFTPVLGLEVEGQVFFNDHNFQRWTKTFVKGTNIFVNGTVNLMNLFGGYKGTPRTFEIKTNTGLGWLHFWDTSNHSLSAKTALDFNFNLGKKKAHTIFVSPGVYWDLNAKGKVEFDKRFAQFAVFVGYVYHFKTSNGTHHFKTYDVGAMNAEINRLTAENQELAKKANRGPVKPDVKVIKEVEVVTETRYVTFAQNSFELDSVAMAELDKVQGLVDIYGYASPEGSETYNKELSQKRADTVAAYLRKRNVGVREVVGMGVVGITSNRIAIVHNVNVDPNKK